MSIQLLNRIGGGRLPAASGATFEIRSPTDGSLVATAPASSAAEVDAAVAAAGAAFARWRSVPAPARGEILLKAALVLERRKEELALCMAREMGKRLEEARGDVQEAIDTAHYAGTEGRRLFGRTAPSELSSKLGFTVRRPIGVAAVITAWNFPVAVPSWKIFPALVCGNAVVWKPAEEAPAVADLFAAALEEAGLPPGVLNLVHGDGEGAGAPLVAHRGVALISFTGSSPVGRRVAEIAGRTLKHVSLELGGKNPVVVMPDADLELAVDGLLWGAFGTAGQRCTATSRLIAVGDAADRLLPRLLARARELRLGDPLDPATDVGPLISAAHRERVHACVAGAVRAGARLLCGGEPSRDPRLAPGWFYPPTVLEAERGTPIALEEVFGPVLAVLRAGSLDAAIEIANEVEYGLSSSIYTADVGAAMRAVEQLDAGITYVNAPTIGAEAHFPFGGVKQTGNGHREGGWAPYEFFSEVKTVYVDYSGRLQRAQIDNRPLPPGGQAG